MLLLRHGQSAFNAVYSVTRVDPGIPDPELTEDGRRQAAEAAERLASHPVRRIITSPYTRALQTAEIVAGRLGVPVTVNADVRERYGFACDIGTHRTHLSSRWPALAFDHLPERWWPEAEEPEPALEQRCIAFRKIMCDIPDWRHVAVVTHWGFIRGLTGRTVGTGEILCYDPVAAAVDTTSGF